MSNAGERDDVVRADPVAALKNYMQADAEGIMVYVSRQAVDEAAAEIVRLTAVQSTLDTMVKNQAASIQRRDAQIVAAEGRAEKMRESKGSILAGLDLFLAATHADDPKREMLVRIGDLMREVRALDLTAEEPS